MTTHQHLPSVIQSKPWLLHLVFWIIIITYIAVHLFSIEVKTVHSSLNFSDFQKINTKADLRIRLSQPSSRMTNGVHHYQLDGWIERVDIPETTWKQIRLFLVDKQGGLYWIADQTGSDSTGIITSPDIQVPNTSVKISIPPSLIRPGVYTLGAEICSTEDNCYYSMRDSRYLYVTPNSMQFVKPNNLAKIQSIGTRQRALNFLNETFFPVKK